MGMIASPVTSVDLKREGVPGLIAAINQYSPIEVVIGLPTGMSGREGMQAKEVREFAAQLVEYVPVPFVFWDERLTTFAADQALMESGHRGKRRKELVDAVAASLILQSYLDSLR
jgi:putative holliday junction resolvase